MMADQRVRRRSHQSAQAHHTEQNPIGVDHRQGVDRLRVVERPQDFAQRRRRRKGRVESDDFRTHAPADRLLRVAEDVGGQITLLGREPLHQPARHRGGQFVDQRHPIVGFEVGEGRGDLLVAQGTDQVLLQHRIEFLEYLRGLLLGQQPVEHRALGGRQSFQNVDGLR